MSRTLIAVAMAALVVLAGCAGAGTLSEQSPAAGSPTDGSPSGEQGSVKFYISDEKNAIDQFEHLNVTITAIGFKKADAESDDEDAENETEIENGTEIENETDSTEVGNETELENETETSETREEVQDKQESDDWVVKQVDSRTVDLTELQGANASSLGTFGIDAGTYTKVFVYVSDVNATLKSGQQVNVKLPSQKLHVNKQFTVGPNQTTNFVFDITVFEAGKSGKYILKPVVSQSGTDVRIDDVDDEDEDERGDDESSALDATFVTNVTAGENATLRVARNGTPVANATVSVNDEVVGQTDANGTLTVAIPTDTDELEVEITGPDGAEAELEVRLSTGDANSADEDSADEDSADSDAEDGDASFDVSLSGNVTAGEEVTVTVTDGDDPVRNAKVFVEGELVGQTDAEGQLTLTVPSDADTFTLSVRKDGQSVTRTVTVGDA